MGLSVQHIGDLIAHLKAADHADVQRDINRVLDFVFALGHHLEGVHRPGIFQLVEDGVHGEVGIQEVLHGSFQEDGLVALHFLNIRKLSQGGFHVGIVPEFRYKDVDIRGVQLFELCHIGRIHLHQQDCGAV